MITKSQNTDMKNTAAKNIINAQDVKASHPFSDQAFQERVQANFDHILPFITKLSKSLTPKIQEHADSVSANDKPLLRSMRFYMLVAIKAIQLIMKEPKASLKAITSLKNLGSDIGINDFSALQNIKLENLQQGQRINAAWIQFCEHQKSADLLVTASPLLSSLSVLAQQNQNWEQNRIQTLNDLIGKKNNKSRKDKKNIEKLKQELTSLREDIRDRNPYLNILANPEEIASLTQTLSERQTAQDVLNSLAALKPDEQSIQKDLDDAITHSDRVINIDTEKQNIIDKAKDMTARLAEIHRNPITNKSFGISGLLNSYLSMFGIQNDNISNSLRGLMAPDTLKRLLTLFNEIAQTPEGEELDLKHIINEIVDLIAAEKAAHDNSKGRDNQATGLHGILKSNFVSTDILQNMLDKTQEYSTLAYAPDTLADLQFLKNHLIQTNQLDAFPELDDVIKNLEQQTTKFSDLIALAQTAIKANSSTTQLAQTLQNNDILEPSEQNEKGDAKAQNDPIIIKTEAVAAINATLELLGDNIDTIQNLIGNNEELIDILLNQNIDISNHEDVKNFLQVHILPLIINEENAQNLTALTDAIVSKAKEVLVQDGGLIEKKFGQKIQKIAKNISTDGVSALLSSSAQYLIENIDRLIKIQQNPGNIIENMDDMLAILTHVQDKMHQLSTYSRSQDTKHAFTALYNETIAHLHQTNAIDLEMKDLLLSLSPQEIISKSNTLMDWGASAATFAKPASKAVNAAKKAANITQNMFSAGKNWIFGAPKQDENVQEQEQPQQEPNQVQEQQEPARNANQGSSLTFNALKKALIMNAGKTQQEIIEAISWQNAQGLNNGLSLKDVLAANGYSGDVEKFFQGVTLKNICFDGIDLTGAYIKGATIDAASLESLAKNAPRFNPEQDVQPNNDNNMYISHPVEEKIIMMDNITLTVDAQIFEFSKHLMIAVNADNIKSTTGKLSKYADVYSEIESRNEEFYQQIEDAAKAEHHDHNILNAVNKAQMQNIQYGTNQKNMHKNLYPELNHDQKQKDQQKN